MSVIKKIVLLCTVAMMVSGVVSATAIQPAAAAPAFACVPYVVQRGETLSGIAWRFGTNWIALGQANGIPDPNRIYAGMVLCVPTNGMYTGGYGYGGYAGYGYGGYWPGNYGYGGYNGWGGYAGYGNGGYYWPPTYWKK